MLALAVSTGGVQPRWMTQPTYDEITLVHLGRALAYLRKEAGLSQPAAAERIGTSAQNWGKYENGKATSLYQPEVQRRLAGAVNSNIETLQMVASRLRGDFNQQIDHAHAVAESGAYAHLARPTLPIQERLQAAWIVENSAPLGSWHIGRDPRWERADQWLAEMYDDHAEGLGIGRGDLVQCVSAPQTGFYPRTNDLVIVERVRPVEEREVTLRQVENTATGVLLHARTSNPRLRQPLELSAAPHEATEGPRILAFVSASVRRY